jgi:hypothetical protein
MARVRIKRGGPLRICGYDSLSPSGNISITQGGFQNTKTKFLTHTLSTTTPQYIKLR